MHGASLLVFLRFDCATDAPFPFAGLQELPEVLQSFLQVSGFILAATVTDYAGRSACILYGPGFARECCAAKDFLARARTSMKYRVRAACCAAVVFTLRTNNWSTFGEMVADLGGGKAGLGKCGRACDALHHLALSAHIYATSFCPPKRLQAFVYSTRLAETVMSACLCAGCVGRSVRTSLKRRAIIHAPGSIQISLCSMRAHVFALVSDLGER